MISKTTHGSDFRGVLNYLLDPAKRPTIIAPYMLGQTVDELTREFDSIANLRPTTRLPVRHISLAFAPEDGVIEDVDKEAIVVRILAEMGYKDCQFIGIAHHRDDPGHDQAHQHDHLHIVVNAVNVHGERISDSHERFRIQPILRKIEQDFGLKQVPNSWDVKRQKAQKIIPETDLSVEIDRSLNGCPNLESWIDRLAQSEIDIRFTLRKDGAVRGITYLHQGKAYKGSEIGKSWAVVDLVLKTTPADLPTMLLANLKSQEHRVQLTEADRQQFERATAMAVRVLKGKSKFKSGRIEIELDGENSNLTVYRMRPHRQMLKATRTKRGWEPVGYPNIDAKDLELLCKLAGTSRQNFYETVATGLKPNMRLGSNPSDRITPVLSSIPKTAVGTAISVNPPIPIGADEGKSIGIPNIDAKKDLQILGDLKIEVEVVQVDRSALDNAQTAKEISKQQQPRSRRQSNQLG